ncbi:pyridoxine/pyridoxamine 5'-phosphate oxidase [Streptomyces fuscigenes]|uniref:pyridoxine/pyridoxamine 5'-phosphate oxidase n=1 Tax=Streptomyces fuscigenes TaxID=1528880 RepID=UPI001F461CED|nr:pyridoxal 5'-phosphate synthase [Streptomyces fuscigenes]MCF3964702.1 pyridoxal 5'-phosphate synthase [Streptomyces fuscigenes]
MEHGSLRELLRGIEVFAGDDLPGFDPADTPPAPDALFVVWLRAALAAGVREPHAMTLSTVDADGRPDARVLIVKNVDAESWQFAVHADSPKGRELAAHGSAALTFYWPRQARQVRVRGPVSAEPAERGAADFLARSPEARAEALLGTQSRPLSDLAERDRRTKESLARVEREPDLVAPAWTLYGLRAEQVEFWQGDKGRRHTRLVYLREADGWRKQLLWP